MPIEYDFEINSPIERVWEVVGDDFANVGDWATPVPSSRPRTDTNALPDAPVAGRVCDVNGPGVSSVAESLIRFDPENHTLTYRVDSGMPGFVSRLENNWTLTEVTTNRTRVSVRMVLEGTGLRGRLALPFLRLFIKRTLRQSRRDLTHFLEHGEPSAAKQKQLAKIS